MKRSWMGFILLLILLVLGILTTKIMVDIHKTVEEGLQEAAFHALKNDWSRAESAFRKARADWDNWEHFRACFADHNPVEEIDSSFALLETYCITRENAAFAAECRRLARQTAAVGEAHELVWWNIF